MFFFICCSSLNVHTLLSFFLFDFAGSCVSVIVFMIRLKSNWPAPKFILLENLRSVELSWIAAAQRRAVTGSPSLSDDDSITTVEDGSKKPKRAPTRSRKKAPLDVAVESNVPDVNSDSQVGDDFTVVASIPNSRTTRTRGRKKGITYAFVVLTIYKKADTDMSCSCY